MPRCAGLTKTSAWICGLALRGVFIMRPKLILARVLTAGIMMHLMLVAFL